MRTHRLYYPELNPTDTSLILDKSASHYLLQVLRCKPGQPLQLFDGRGTQCDAVLQGATRHAAEVNLRHCNPVDRESPLHIRLALGISKGERMDFAIQKAVELGVSEIQPLQTEHSVVNLSTERAEKRLRHWQGIIISACEQCGRNQLPQLHPVQPLAQWLVKAPAGLLWLFEPQGQQRLAQQSRPEQAITLLIGPEGGLSAGEIDSACQAGFTPLLFGPRILRTETAVVASLSAIQTLWGDLC